MRILIAEDEKDLNRVIARKLREDGYLVDTAFDGGEALDYLRSINPENKMASEPECAADKTLWDMWFAYMSSECRCYQGHMPRTGRRDVLAQAEAEAKKRLLMDYRMLESRIGHANEMLDFERRCSGSGVSLQLIHGKRRPSPVEAMPTPVPTLAMA